MSNSVIFQKNVLNKNIIKQFEQDTLNKFKADWCTKVAAYAEESKLRTYKLFKMIIVLIFI